jgi:hypothetical protein
VLVFFLPYPLTYSYVLFSFLLCILSLPLSTLEIKIVPLQFNAEQFLKTISESDLKPITATHFLSYREIEKIFQTTLKMRDSKCFINLGIEYY